MAHGGNHDVGRQRRAAGQPHEVPAVVVLPWRGGGGFDADRGVLVDGDGGVRSKLRDRAPEEPFQVGALELPGGESGAGGFLQLAPQLRRELGDVGDGAVQDAGGPVGQGRDRLPRALRTDTDPSVNMVTSAAAELSMQAGVLFVAPDPPGARGVRLDHVDVQGCVEESGRLAARRSRMPAVRGPPPTKTTVGAFAGMGLLVGTALSGRFRAPC